VDAAAATDVQALTERIREIVPEAAIVRAASPVTLEDPAVLAGQRVLIVEDGPTITHGGMPFGAGYVAASSVPDVRIIDPRPYAAAMIRQAYERYPHIGPVLPALGYGDAQISALRDTINKTDADVVVSATPIDLAALMEIDKPVVRARYEFADAGPPTLAALVQRFLEERFDTLAAG
jgi:predicted GTPase